MTELTSERWGRGAVGDIAVQTATEHVGEGRHTAMVHDDWEIWGPCGGYVAAIALRAAGAESRARPAGELLLPLPVGGRIRSRRHRSHAAAVGRTVLAQRVEMTQEARPVLDAMVWSVGEVAGLEHEDTSPPDVPGPDELPN